jgi:1-deoxy-D-xylulose-5-phosphate reductoisomerase
MSDNLKILLLGSTGSIGKGACNCVRRHPDRFCLTGLTTNTRADDLIAQAGEFNASWLYAGSPEAAARIRASLTGSQTIFDGPQGLEDIVNNADYDIVLNALVGAVGLRPTVAALKRGKRVALANKESLVIGGDFITKLINNGHGSMLPVDSEHSAILQCLAGEKHECIESLILTASGGPFRSLPASRFRDITPEQALNHPTWSMGKKITIDAGTLMNKGFEVIEAHHLFNLSYDSIRVLIHPQSIIHSMVEFHDGAIIAQLGIPDMELPIQFALGFPDRLPLPGKRLDLAGTGNLSFDTPDMDRFPCLRLALEAGKKSGSYPVVLNASNEIAVQYFLDGRIRFDEIGETVARALDNHTATGADSLEAIEEIDRKTRHDTIVLLTRNG